MQVHLNWEEEQDQMKMHLVLVDIAGGGFLGIRTIEFITISTFGDSQDFGDLTAAGANSWKASSIYRNQNVICRWIYY